MRDGGQDAFILTPKVACVEEMGMEMGMELELELERTRKWKNGNGISLIVGGNESENGNGEQMRGGHVTFVICFSGCLGRTGLVWTTACGGERARG